jgi:rubrerythrin
VGQGYIITQTLKGNQMPLEKSSITLENLASALAGESQAHIKYRYFAKIAREEGHEEVARHFEHTADQELLHAWGHLELLVGRPSTRKCLELAIEGETYEFTTMYPGFEEQARAENDRTAQYEFRNQIMESSEHAEQFKAVLAKAEKRFSALKRVEQRHAAAYTQVLENL